MRLQNYLKLCLTYPVQCFYYIRSVSRSFNVT